MSSSTPSIVIASIMPENGASGVQAYANTFKKYLSGRNIPTTLITPFSCSPIAYAPVFAVRKLIDPFHDEWSTWWYERWHYHFLKIALSKQLERHEKKGTPTVVFAQSLLAARAALEVRKNHRQRVFLVVHFNISEADEWVGLGKIKYQSNYYKTIKSLEKSLLPKLDGILYVSEFMRETMERVIPELKYVKSVCLPCFTKAPVTKTKKYEGDLISIGSLDKRKNQAYLLRVLAHAKQKGYTYTLSLVGDGSERQHLKKLSYTLGIAEEVRFLGYQKDAAQLLNHYRAYVHSALIENLPISLLEALAYNLPILAGAVGGIPEIFDDGIEGFYWPLDDPEAGATKLIQLMENDGIYRNQVEASERKYIHHFNTEQVACNVLDFLQSQSLPASTSMRQ